MQEATEPFAIRVRDLVVGFRRHVVIDHLALDVRRGEILGLVGPNGSGKSTLINVVSGHYRAGGGSIKFEGRELVGEAPHRIARAGIARTYQIPRQGGEIEVMGSPINHDRTTRSAAGRWGILFQQGALFSSLTVRQNIQFPLRENLVLSDALMDEIATAKLEMVGLKPEDGDKFPSELSGGMTKRVALARALALDPAIVFLDEPTSGLDPIAAGDFDALIKTLQQTLGLTVFMVTHDLASLNTVCDRVAALADGKIVAIGPMRELLQSEHPWVRAYFHGKRFQMLKPRAS